MRPGRDEATNRLGSLGRVLPSRAARYAAGTQCRTQSSSIRACSGARVAAPSAYELPRFPQTQRISSAARATSTPPLTRRRNRPEPSGCCHGIVAAGGANSRAVHSIVSRLIWTNTPKGRQRTVGRLDHRTRNGVDIERRNAFVTTALVSHLQIGNGRQ